MAANNTIDESIALITAANTVVQDPAQVGNAFKTISMRIRGAKTELEEMGEDTTGMVESTAKLRSEILALSGVDIMENANEFKSTYKIMDELAAKWEDLTDIQQATVTELIAGKRQGNIVSSLMTNFDTARDALETSLNSSGSAMREHEKWQQSLEAQINKLKASWQGLSQAFLSSDFLHGALDAVIGLVDGLTLLIDKVGVLPTLFTGFSIFKSFGNKGLFKTFNNDLDGFTNKVGIANKSFAELMNAFNSKNTGGFKGFISGLKSMGDALANSLSQSDLSAIESYNKLIDDGIDGQTAFAQTMKGTSNAAQGLVRSAEGSKVAINGVKNASIGGKVALLGMKTAALLMNAALTMGISLLIDFAISGIMKLVNADKELAESVEEITSKFKQEHDELKKLKDDYDTDSESSMISKYEKLSKGVDNLGRNVSLTSEEYSEYQSIVNQIAEQIPSLVSGYDEQGNALLSVKGNVDALTEAYEKLIHAQNQEILTNAGDIEKDFANTVKKSSGEFHGLSIADGHGFWAGVLNGLDLVGLFSENYDLKTDTVRNLERLLNASNKSKRDKIYEKIKVDDFSTDEIRTALERANVEIGYFDDPLEVLEETLESNPQKVKNIIDDYYAQFAEVIEKQKTIGQAKLSEAFDVSSVISGVDYSNISKELQDVAYQIVNGLDFDFFADLEEDGKSFEDWIDDLLEDLNEVSETDSAKIKSAFDLQTQFNGGEISFGEYINNLQEVQSAIDEMGLKRRSKQQLKINLGLNDDGVIDQYNALLNRLTDTKSMRPIYQQKSDAVFSKRIRETTEIDQAATTALGEPIILRTERVIKDKKYRKFNITEEEAKEFLDSLSSEEYAALVKIIPDLDVGTTLDEIKSLINEQLAQEFTFDIKVQTKGIEALNTALAESRSATGLTAESIAALKARYEDLDGFNAFALFEKTANGIHLNNEELSRLEEQYINTNKLEINKNLSSLVEKYQDVNNKLKTNTSLTEAERKELESSKESLADKIDELSTLASQYDGLTSAFANWQNALNGAEEGDNYDSVFENLEAMKELDDKGLVGTDKYKTFAQLMSDEDLSTASIDELNDAFDKGYKKAARYFTEGKKGSKNFLNDLNAISSEWAHINEDGIWEVDINAEEVAKKLGISVEAVLLILDKLKDYGIKVEVEDSSVNNLQTKIQETEAKLKELGQSPVDINIDIVASSANLGKIESEIEKAKTKITEINNSSVSPEVKTAQLEDAKAKLEALIQKKQEVNQPAFMSLNTSQVNASLVDALEKIQDYQTALNELNKLNELKASGIAIDDSEIDTAKEKLNEFAKAIQGLDGDVKVAIGLEEDGSVDSIHQSFKNGKVKIDADTDPAVSKIGQLAETVEKISDKDITINVTVNGLDDVKQLNEQINLATKIDGDIDKLSEYVENAKALKDLGENITSYVTAEVKGNVVDEFEYKIDNLKVFFDSAKDIEKIGYVQSEVTADIKGNVTDEFEYKINNLKVFSDSAKDVDKVGDVESTVKANIEGNVTDEFEYKINNLKVFSESAKDIYKIGNVESNVKATINSGEDGDVIDEFEYKLNNLKKFAEYAKELQNISDVDISVKATVNTGDDGDVVDEFEYKLDNLSEFANHVKELQGLKSIDISVDAVVNTGEDGDVVDEFEYKLDNLTKFADHVKELQGLESVDVSVNATVNTGNDGDAVDTFEYKLNNLEAFAEGAKALQGIGDISSEITAKVNTGESGDAVDTFEYKLNNLKTFAEGAKALQGVGNVSSTVTAEINSGSDGDVIDEFEYKLNNLEKFAQYAKDLQGVGSVNVSVSAKVNTGEDGDVTDTFEYKLNNLDEFASYAKELQGLEDVNISIKANVDTSGEDSVVNEFEYKLNNLSEFATYAKDLQGLKSVDITISANAKGNVVGEKTEGKINNLEVFAKGAKGLKGIESKEITITANAKGNVVGDKTEGKINNLEVFAVGAKKVQNLESKDITITANAKGNVVGKKTESKINNLEVFAKGAKSLQGISSKEVNITANADGNVVGDKTEGKINNLKVFGDSAKALNGVESKKVSITADANGNVVSGEGASSRLSSLTEFKSLISGMSNQTVTVSVTANVDAANINQAITLLTNVANSGVFKDYKATVQVGAKIATIDDTTVKNYKTPPKEGKVKYSVDSESSVYTWTAPSKDGVVNYDAIVDPLTDSQKHKRGTITYDVKLSGFPVVNGTANVNGSAFANGTSGKALKQGDWGVKKTTTALTGELGQELVVYGNRFWTVGDHGAEFTTIPKGAIVFNHKQTAELFKNGKVTSDGGRGRVFASGTAYVEGTAFAPGKDGFYGNDDGDPSPSNNKFEETIDWIEIILDRAERAIDKYEQQADNIYKTWDKRNKALENEIAEIDNTISLYEQAKNKYLSEANAVGLSESYASKVRNGSLSIQDFEGESNEKLVEKIKNYQDLYNKYLDCVDKIDELKEQEASLYAQRFDHVSEEYDNLLQGFDHTQLMLDEYISQAEAKGQIVSKNYYDALINNENDRIKVLKQEQAALIKARDEAVANNEFDKYSEEWYNMCADIDNVTQDIENGTTSIIEYNNAIRDIEWETFDLIQQRISDITAEADFLIELMSNKKLFEDDGKLTSQGLATIGLHGQNYNAYMYQSDDYAKEIAKIDKQLAKGYSKDLEERRRELIGLHRDMILAAEDEKNAIRDMVEEGINLELDALQEKIDLYNEALESQKDLYDYQKRVEEQTKNIASLQKQLSAYEGDNSEEAKAKIQELKVSLEEAEADLEETQYDKYIADQSALLDNLYEQYSEILNTRLDNVDALLEQVIEGINLAAGTEGTLTSALGSEGAIALALSSNATSIGQTLKTEATNVGTTLSDAMNNIWNTGEGNAKSVLEMYGNGFQSKQTTTNAELSSIKSSVNSLVSAANKEAEKKVTANKTTTSAKKDPTKNTNDKKPTTTSAQTNTNKSTGDGKPKVGDKVTFVSGQYYYSSQGVSPLGSKYQGKQVYITNINNASWATHPYHISTGKTLGSGDLGWLKLNQLNGYVAGKKKIHENEYAWTQEQGREYIVRPSDGAILTPVAKGDSVLTSAATNNIWQMANNPAEFIKDNLNLGATSVPNNSTVQSNYTQHIGNVVFRMDNIKNYDEILDALQKDKNFERLVESMSIGKLAGKSSLAKGKAIR